MFHHKRSFYPFAIALLTLALGGLMYLTLTKSAPSAGPATQPAVTESDYRSEAHSVIAPFLTAYQGAATDVAKLVAVEDAVNGLMPLIVPASFKDLHFGLAVSLTLMRDGLRGEDPATVASGYAKLMQLVGDYPWLAE